MTIIEELTSEEATVNKVQEFVEQLSQIDEILFPAFTSKLETIKENSNKIVEFTAAFDAEIHRVTQLQQDLIDLLQLRIDELKNE